MSHKIIAFLFFTSFILVSCETSRPKNTISAPSEMKSDSSEVVTVKPLSTEKTHEGGVDKTQQIFKIH